MKRFKLDILILLFTFLSIDIYAQKDAKPLRNTSTFKDSIEYYEVEIEGRQKNYKELLMGNWSIDTMRQQARAVPDGLVSMFLNFQTDSTFSLRLSCNQLQGTYRLKGTSIKFMDINMVKTDCRETEQEFMVKKLLTQTVSAYTVENDILLLRDGSSNVIFKASRKKG